MCPCFRVRLPDQLSDSVQRFDQLLWKTSGADQRNRVAFHFIGSLHWFPIATDGIVGPSPTVDWGLCRYSLTAPLPPHPPPATPTPPFTIVGQAGT